MRFRRKVWYVEAFQYDGDFCEDDCGKLRIPGDIPKWATEALEDGTLYFKAGDLYVNSQDYGERWVMRNEFIVKDEDGAIYNLPPELFTRMYERCGDDESFI